MEYRRAEHLSACVVPRVADIQVIPHNFDRCSDCKQQDNERQTYSFTYLRFLFLWKEFRNHSPLRTIFSLYPPALFLSPCRRLQAELHHSKVTGGQFTVSSGACSISESSYSTWTLTTLTLILPNYLNLPPEDSNRLKREGQFRN